MAPSEPFRELVEQHAVTAMLCQQRLLRLTGEEAAWSADLDEGRFTIGSWRFRADVLGTESSASGAWLWSWANPSLRPEQTLSAGLLWQLGTRYGVPELAAEGEVPLSAIDAHLAGIAGVGEASADGYYVGPDGERAVVFLVRHPGLADAPFTPVDLLGAMNALTVGGLPFDTAAALEAFAAAPLEGFSVTTERRQIRLGGPGGSAAIFELDRRGRVKHATFASADAVPPPPLDDDADDADEDEGLVDVGVLTVPADGRLGVLDPYLVVDGLGAGTLPTDAFAGTHRVAVALHEDPAGGERVELAYVLLDPDAEAVTWQPVGDALVDSGVVAFVSGPALAALEGGGVPPELDAALAASARPTWEHAALDGLVAVSCGLGDGEARVLFGFDADDRLVRVGIDCLSGWELDELDETGDHDVVAEAAPGDTPGPGLQRALLLAGALGGAPDPENVVLLPPAANRALARLDRRLLAATAASEVDVTGHVLPEYDDPTFVPSRIRVLADGPDPFDETITVTTLAG